MGRIGALFWTAFSRLADAVQLLGYPGFIAMVSSIAIPAWAAWATDWLSVWGPISWVFCGLIGALLFSALALIWAAHKKLLAMAQYHSAMSKPPSRVNPLRSDFTDEKLDLDEFFHPIFKQHRGKTFRRCHIHGPGAMVILGESGFYDHVLNHCDIVEVANGTAMSCVIFDRTTFIECQFFNVTFLMAPVQVDALVADHVRHGRRPPDILRSRQIAPETKDPQS